jgi:putative hydrolase of the HAD superfamily
MLRPVIRATLWDFGGVIMTGPFEAFSRYERDNGLPDGFIRRINATDPDTNAWACLERGTIGREEFCARFEDEARAAGGAVDAAAIVDLLRGELRPAMVEALRRCHRRLRTALVTNNFVTAEQRSPEVSAVFDHFDVIVESSRSGLRKPDPAIYELVCRQLEVEPSEVVFLDDLGVNLKPARHLGMTTIKVVNPEEALTELESVVGFPVG